MNARSLVLSLVALFLLVTGQNAAAQTPSTQPPPDSLAVSPYGVDMVTGIYRNESSDLVIGDPASGGIEYKLANAKVPGTTGIGNPTPMRVSNWFYRIEVAAPNCFEGFCNPETLVSLFYLGVSQNWISYDSGAPPFYDVGARSEGVSKLERNSSGAFVYTATDGTIIEFYSPSGRFSYAKTIRRPDGVRYDIVYANASSPGSGMRVTSNTGYQLIEQSGRSKVCVLNIAVTAAQTGFTCPVSATSVSYSSTSMSDWSKTDQLGGVEVWTSTNNGYGTVTGRRPGYTQPWITMTTGGVGGIAGHPVVTQQVLSSGPTISYGYELVSDFEYSNEGGGGVIQPQFGRGTSWTINSTDTTTLQWGVNDCCVIGSPAPPPRVTPGPITVTDSIGRVTSTEYNGGVIPYTTIASRTLPSGMRQTFGYGIGGTIDIVTTSPSTGSGETPLTKQYVHDCTNPILCLKPTQVIDARGNATDYTWSPVHAGMLTETAPADANGIRARKTYTWTNLTATWNGGSGQVWKLTSISECRTQATCVGTADEVVTTFTYSSTGNLNPLTQTVTSQGVSLTTTWTWSAMGDKLSEDGPATGTADTTHWRYDAMRRKTGEIGPDPDGAGALLRPAVRTTYDAAGRVIRVETGSITSVPAATVAPANWTGFTVFTTAETDYDIQSRKTVERVKGDNGVTVSLTQYSYDSFGRLECTAVRMNPAVYGSLPASACTLGTAGLNGADRITRTIYDAAGQVLQIRKAVGTPREIADVTYRYTQNGKIEQVVDANGNRAELRYDGFDRQTRWVFPAKTRPTAFNPATPATALASAGALNEADFEQYSYDANGNRTLLRKRDGSRIAFSYDALNRVTFKDICATGSTSCTGLAAAYVRDMFYEYDLRGLQTKARFDSLTGPGITYAYDGFGRLTSETQNTDGVSRVVSSLYDVSGNRTRVTYPDGQFFTYDFDGLDRATALREGTTQLGTVTFNNRGLPTQLTWTALTTTANARSFGYDPVGRLSSIGFDLNGTVGDVTWSYTRNPASQIITETQSNDSYAWDGYVALSRAYTTNGLNQYESAGSAAFCYDANGNLAADGSSVYLYDVENRLVEKRAQGTGNTNCAALSYTGALQAQLLYDPTGRLYQVSGGAAGIQRFAYDGNAMIGEYNSAGTMLRRYVHGSNAEADDPLIWYEGATQTATLRRYLHADPRGSIVAVTDHTGNRIATNTYDEYGIPDTATGNDIATKGRFRYTGQAWIPELGMYYYKARIYSPTLGRFLQTDPIGYEDQFNLYVYVDNDPINHVDYGGERRRPRLLSSQSPTGFQSRANVRVLQRAVPGYKPPATIRSTQPSARSYQVEAALLRGDYQALSIIGFGNFNNRSYVGEGLANPNRAVARIQTAFSFLTYNPNGGPGFRPGPGVYNFSGGNGGMQAAESFARSLGGTRTGSTSTGSRYALTGLPSGVTGSVATYNASSTGGPTATVTLVEQVSVTGTNIRVRVKNEFKVRFDN